MRKFLQALWRDQHGFIVSSELVFVATLLVIGLLTGITTIRDQVLGELGDLADAVSEVNQSFTIAGVEAHASSTAGVTFVDEEDFCEVDGNVSDQLVGNLPQCLDIITGESE